MSTHCMYLTHSAALVYEEGCVAQEEGACGSVAHVSSSVKSYFHSSPETGVLGAGRAPAEPKGLAPHSQCTANCSMQSSRHTFHHWKPLGCWKLEESQRLIRPTFFFFFSVALVPPVRWMGTLMLGL